MHGLVNMLVIDDDPQQRHDLGVILNFMGEHHNVLSSQDVTRSLWDQPWGICLLGTISNIKRLNAIMEGLKMHPKIPVVVLANHQEILAELPNYVSALKFPLHYNQLADALYHCQEYLGQCVHQMPSLKSKNMLFRSMIGRSEAITDIRRLVEQVAACDASVLILGESGTGKEVVARNVHYHSERGRSKGIFVSVNCGAILPDLLESELFGYEKGAFPGAITTRKGRFELAEGGTLFLDEIGDMPMSIQAKLLRALQERSFERVGGSQTIKTNVRIVAATHRNLEQMIANGLFREDLYYRLNVFPINMPTLRDRIEDIPLLLQELLTRMEAEGAKRIRFTPLAIASLMLHDWPGNIRELANLVERLSIIYPDEIVDIDHLPAKYSHNQLPDFMHKDRPLSVEEQKQQTLVDMCTVEKTGTRSLSKDLPPEGLNLKKMLAELEVGMIRQALDAKSRVVARAAEMLGMRRTTLVEKMRKYGLSKDS